MKKSTLLTVVQERIHKKIQFLLVKIEEINTIALFKSSAERFHFKTNTVRFCLQSFKI